MSLKDGNTKDPSSNPVSSSNSAPGRADDAEVTLDSTPSSSFSAPTEATRPSSIGPYRLLKKLGEGGMGQVWLAEQTAPFHRQVALKLIRAGMYDDALLQRFQAERQSLAIMNHPSIAKVFDAGATAEGQPYFVMEYVPGLPLTDYCDQKQLNIRERLELFVKVCEGVQHAHQKAIIHRDLKPANILVVEVDGKHTPRIIDFGIAKAVSSQPAAEIFTTKFVGGFVGTPGYMSPEQMDPAVEDVDTRTDVYALGVVLYVLLTGSLPFDSALWKQKPMYEVLRLLREQDPPRPSTKISSDRHTQKTTAELRGTGPQQLRSLLRGDLDWITLKAVEKDRSRRYGTPSELAADIQRYLRNEPVIARPASTSYRLHKYVLRHRVGVGVAAGLAIVLMAFAINQTVQLRRITRERNRADRVTSFMTGMFKVSDPSEARGNTITAREILDKASKDIDTGLSRDPELQAQMMHVMGNVYNGLGLYPRAQSLLQRAVDTRRRVLGVRQRDTLASMYNLAWILAEQGHYIEAEKLQRETLDTQRRVLGPEDRDTLMSAANLATTLSYQGRYAESEKLDRDTLAIRHRILGPEHADTLEEMNNLAVTLLTQGHYAESEKLLRETIDIQRRVLGPDHPAMIRSVSNLAEDLNYEGDYPQSEKLYRELLDTRRRVLGPDHPDTLTNAGNVAALLLEQGRYSEADKLLRETIDKERRVLGPEHPETLLAMTNLANTVSDEGRYPEAEKLYRDILEIQRRVLGPEHPDTLLSAINLAVTFRQEGRLADSEKLSRETFEIQRRVLPADHPSTAYSIYNLGCTAAVQGKRDQALSLLRDAIDHGLSPDVALTIEKDSDLKSLHKDPRFDALLSDIRQRVAAAAQSH